MIYVVPYTSIIEQNAEVFREILGDGNVLEHHSGVQFELSDGSVARGGAPRAGGGKLGHAGHRHNGGAVF